MAKILCRTKGNANPKGKPRVYFTCHPEDFGKYFDRVCEDIFKTHDCAVYYTEDMTAMIREQDKATDLESNNLFVVPVTFRLLSQPNRAMDSDIPFALEKHIPVLPFMMEQGIDGFYAAKFGELQYLNPNSADATEVAYPEKLKRYLESVLISDEMAKRVRAAFDAYIFLSYRKKDRRYANELMRLIHSHPQCRDIAIWYDEFLTPGESFRENIEKILRNSKLFALLVTPNLLEEPGGKPNFVMGEEYPAARKVGIDILPAEMEKTQKIALAKKFKGLPSCVKPGDKAFYDRLLKTVSKTATIANDDDPVHNFLIGLAYLEGIDMEINRERGLELIISAAEADLPEAMEKLYRMYNEGAGVTINYRQVTGWAERLTECYTRNFGREHPKTMFWMNNLAVAYGNLGDLKKALKLQEEVCNLQSKMLGKEHPETLNSLSNLAVAYSELGDHRKAVKLEEGVYTLRRKVLGEEHPDTLTSLSNLAFTYGALGDHKKAKELKEKTYGLQCKALGEEHPETLITLSNLASTYGDLGNFQKQLELEKKVFALRCKVLGEEHPNTLTSLNNLAAAYSDLGQHEKVRELFERAYTLRRKILGQEHPDTLVSLNNLAATYCRIGDYKKALGLHEKAYAIRRKVLGEEHPGTLVSLSNLAFVYGALDDFQKQLELGKRAYEIRCRVMGEEHPDTLTALNNLAASYSNLGDHKKAKQLQQKAYEIRCKVLGAEHPETINAFGNLAVSYYNLGVYSKAAEMIQKTYTLMKKVLGPEHPDTVYWRSLLQQL